MKKTTILILLFIALTASAQSAADIRNYIATYTGIALEQEMKYHIPASITLAQGILESGAGKSGLARNANNHFGVKCHGSWKGGVYKAWDDEAQKSSFRIYSSVRESYEDHSRFLAVENRSRYARLFTYHPYDYVSWAYGLKACGYATAPNYAQALIGYIESYRLYAVNGGPKLNHRVPVAVRQTTTPTPSQGKTQVVQISPECIIEEDVVTEEELSVRNILDRFKVQLNDVRCTILCPGETLTQIAMRYDIPKTKLLEFNECRNESDIHEGDVVFLAKKKKKFTGPQDFHYVKDGETLHSIAQEYGIITISLAKMNHIKGYHPLQEGERLRLK